MLRPEVYDIINGERNYQERKWGTVEQHPHEVGGWILLMEKVLSDARREWTNSRGDDRALDELRKVVALGVACMEQHGAVPRS